MLSAYLQQIDCDLLQVGNVPFAPREFGRIGYDAPVAQPTTFRLESHHTDGINTIADETNSIFVGDYAPRSHTDTCCAVDTSSCYADGLGGALKFNVVTAL